MSPRSQAPLSLEFMLLGFAAQGPVHGYDLHKRLRMQEGISSIWHLKQSQLYALLDKLESLGLLRAEAAPGSVYAPRKEYHLTDDGRQAFEEWLVSPVTHARDMRQEFLARLYFAQQAGGDSAQRLVEAQYAECFTWRKNLLERLDRNTGTEPFQRVVDEYRLNQVEAILLWLDQCRTTLAL